MLERCREEELEEKKKQADRKQKVIKEKYQRDVMLMEYESKKKNDFRREMNSEAEYLHKLR